MKLQGWRPTRVTYVGGYEDNKRGKAREREFSRREIEGELPLTRQGVRDLDAIGKPPPKTKRIDESVACPRCGSWMPRGCPCDDYYQTTPDPEDVHAS